MLGEQKATKNFTFLSRKEYFAELADNISRLKVGERVTVATMAFMPEELAVANILNELRAAAERGVAASLAVDGQIFLVNDKKILGPWFYFKELPDFLLPTFKRKLQIIQELRLAGVKVVVTNKPQRPFINPFSGRSHIKLAVINDVVYVGGCNLSRVDDIDEMVRWQDKKTADWLYKFEQDVIMLGSRRPVMQDKDRTLIINADTELIIDSGVKGQSLIFEKALRLIDEAESSIFITCQFFPNSLTAKHLLDAHRRGVNVKILYNHPSKHGAHRILQRLVIVNEQSKLPKVLFREQLPKEANFLHAKVIVTDKGTILGSHNYIAAGVNFGTAEIAVLSHDTEFGQEALAALNRQLGSKNKFFG